MENYGLQPQPFAFDVYTQLGQVQRDIGSLTASQQAMAEQLRQHEVQMRDSESRIIHALNQFEVRITARIDKVESDLSGRIQSTESGLSARIQSTESGLSERIQSTESGLSERIQSTESGLSARIQSTENKLSTLWDRVNRAFWATAGGGVVMGMALGWKPILARVASFLGA